jgi:hypothetical protein
MILISAGLLLAGGAGFLTAQALGISAAAARTVTISVRNGEQGPRGPAGLACPSSYSPGKLVINHPGGQVAIWTCLED